jgi:alkylated DNA repair dioxygenase AlkB
VRGHQADLFQPPPAGLVYRPEVVTEGMEAALVAAFSTLAFKPFEFHGYFGNRRVVSFGWRYDYAGRQVREAEPLPSFLWPLREQAGAIARLPPADFAQTLVTEYAPGAGIGWHRDKPEFKDVVAFSLLAPCTLRFRRRRDEGWERRSLAVAPRSAYLLRGEARSVWEHSIPPLAALRYSVTFRNLAGGNAAG